MSGGEVSIISTLMNRSAKKDVVSGSKQTVLVADDDRRLRELLCKVLTPLDCDIVQAASGEEALTALLQRKVAVIVLDINMPGMDGFETAQLIRDAEELASTPIIFLTGQADAGDLDRGYDLGAVDFLVKPVSRGVFFAKVKALLELDRSFTRLHNETTKLHEQQLQAARSAEIRQREELAFTRRRARLANIFAEASLDLDSLKKTIVTELSQLFAAECLLRLPLPDGDWHDSFAHTETSGAPESPRAWLSEQLADWDRGPTLNRAVMVDELTARGQRVGIICIGRTDGRAFSEVESALFRGVTVAAALALSNATLYRVQAEYAAVMQATGDAILAVDRSGEIRSCNRAATALFCTDGTLIGRSIVELAVDAHRDRLQECLDATLATHQESTLETVCAANDGRPIEVLITLSPIGDAVDLNVAVVVHDLTEIKQAQTVISHLASHDPLTDLANRRQLTERLEEISRQRDDGKLAALLYLDVNKFKAVNDTYGHDVGDLLLVEVADRLRSAVRGDTLVCRVGGDEFIILFEHVPSTSSAVAAGNRILSNAQAQPVRCKNVTLYPSLSMGISVLGASAHTPEELLSQADIAMFEAKKNQRNECVLYTDLIGSRHLGDAYLRAEVASAITRSEFRLVYQPIVNSRTGALFGLEALVRWRVRGEELPASEIIDLVEDAGQAGALAQWTLTHSFNDYVALGRNDLKLHVNLSPAQVLDREFLNHLISARRENGIAPDGICLELTERAFTGDPSSVYADLRRASELGFSIAIDDFGVEHASMATLKHVDVDWLKIDRSFVDGVEESERTQQLVRGQIALAACMQVEVIAEGVEKQEQADWLREAGCVLQQGFLYAHPIEARDLAAELKNWQPIRENHHAGEG